MLLSCLCSVLVMAEWRSLAMAEALGHSAALHWQLKQNAFNTLQTAVDDIRLSTADERHQIGAANATHAFFPHTLQEWQVLQSRLGGQECIAGICRALGKDQSLLAPWSNRMAQAQKLPEQHSVYWVEILPLSAVVAGDPPFLYRITALARFGDDGPVCAWQALWQPKSSMPPSLSSPMRLDGFIRLLPLTP
jgi:hypothetical protein